MDTATVRSALRSGWGWGSLLTCATLTLPCTVSTMHADQAVEVPPSAAVPFTPQPPLRSYIAIRRLESENDRHRKAAWLVVRTELRSDGTFRWQVLEEGGSELIRDRVLREAMEKEAQVHADGRARRGGLTVDNYTFSTPSPVEGGLRVAIEPRKREDMLVRGTLLVSAEGELLQLEGHLVKRPSFWTKSVHLVRHYGRVAGERVPLRLDMVAQVRLVGTSRLSMTYRYLEINGRPVEGESSAAVALSRAGSAAAATAPR
jgi:hypothetical protein